MNQPPNSPFHGPPAPADPGAGPPPSASPAPFEAAAAQEIPGKTPRPARGRAGPGVAVAGFGCLVWLLAIGLAATAFVGAFADRRTVYAFLEGDRLVIHREAHLPLSWRGSRRADWVRIERDGGCSVTAAPSLGSGFPDVVGVGVAGGSVWAVDVQGAREVSAERAGRRIETKGTVLAVQPHGDGIQALVERDGALHLARFDGVSWRDETPVAIPGGGLTAGEEAEASGREGEDNREDLGGEADGEEEETEDPADGNGSEEEPDPWADPVQGAGPVSVPFGRIRAGAGTDHRLVYVGGLPWVFWKSFSTLRFSRLTESGWSRARDFGPVENYAVAAEGDRLIVFFDRMNLPRLLGLVGMEHHIFEGGVWRAGGGIESDLHPQSAFAAAGWGDRVAYVQFDLDTVRIREFAGGRWGEEREAPGVSDIRRIVRGFVGTGFLMVVLAFPGIALCSRYAERRRDRWVSTEYGRVRVASLFRRFTAHVVDGGLTLGVVAAYALLVRVGWNDGTRLEPPLSADWVLLAIVAAGTLYGLVLCVGEAVWGTTPGKALLGLRVVRDAEPTVGLRASLARNVFRVIDSLIGQYQLGAVMLAVGDQGRRVGDWVAGTLVIENASLRSPQEPPGRAEP